MSLSNYRSAFRLIKADLERYLFLHKMGGASSKKALIMTLLFERGFKFTFWWRLAGVKSILKPLVWFCYRHYSSKYGIQINTSTRIGGGLYIGHGMGVVINPTAIIGKKFTISQFCTIGSNKGKAAVIGDNVYVAPNVCIVENVHIGNNSSVGAGSVVIHNIPQNVVVAGCPAKIIKSNEICNG